MRLRLSRPTLPMKPLRAPSSAAAHAKMPADPAGRFDHRAGVLHAHARAFGDQVHQQLAKGQDGFPGKGTGVGSVHFHLDRTTFFLSQQLFISNNYEI